MKSIFKNLPFSIAALGYLISLNVGAAGITGGVADPDAPYGDNAEAAPETTTATVTRTEKGIELVAPDGRRVLLKNDHTWEYLEVDQLPPEQSAVLTVVNVTKLGNVCDIGFRLTNNLPYEIKSLVPTFAAYTRDDVVFDSKSKSFSSIKPTGSQYQKVRFIGIACPDILYVRLSGGDRCTMGPFTKFDMVEGECLKRVYIEASDLIKVLK